MHDQFVNFVKSVESYIINEYGTDEYCSELSTDEEHTVNSIIKSYFENDNSPNNTASDIIDYLRSNRRRIKKT